jgi:hypothetical protein
MFSEHLSATISFQRDILSKLKNLYPAVFKEAELSSSKGLDEKIVRNNFLKVVISYEDLNHEMISEFPSYTVSYVLHHGLVSQDRVWYVLPNRILTSAWHTLLSFYLVVYAILIYFRKNIVIFSIDIFSYWHDVSSIILHLPVSETVRKLFYDYMILEEASQGLYTRTVIFFI